MSTLCCPENHSEWNTGYIRITEFKKHWATMMVLDCEASELRQRQLVNEAETAEKG